MSIDMPASKMLQNLSIFTAERLAARKAKCQLIRLHDVSGTCKSFPHLEKKALVRNTANQRAHWSVAHTVAKPRKLQLGHQYTCV